MTMASIEVLQSPGSQARFIGGQAPPRKTGNGGNHRLSPPLINRKPINTTPVDQQAKSCATAAASTRNALDIPRLIPEVKETSVVMSGLLEAYGLPPSPSGTAVESLTAVSRPRTPRNQLVMSPTMTHPKRQLNAAGGQKVIVAVYQTSREHFAVVYPLRMMITARQPIATINLHKSQVMQSGVDSFRVVSTKENKNGNQSALTLKLLKNSTVDLQCWMDAFATSTQSGESCRHLSRSPVMSSYTPVMATLDESDGDEDGESQTC